MLKRFVVKNPDSNEVLSIDQIELPGIVQKLLFWPWLLVVDNYIDRNGFIWLGLVVGLCCFEQLSVIPKSKQKNGCILILIIKN